MERNRADVEAVLKAQPLFDNTSWVLGLLNMADKMADALNFAVSIIEHREGLKHRKDLFTDDELARLKAALPGGG